MVRSRTLVALVALVGLSACSLRSAACGLPSARDATLPAEAEPGAPGLAPPSATGGGSATIKIAFLGDSLTAGFGLLSAQAFPSLIQDDFAAEGYTQVEVVNAGVSGDTTAGGLRRVNAVLDEPGVAILVVALGGNDALRGLTARQTHDNLAGILEAAGRHDAAVVLTGMLAPTNLGMDYQTAFAAVFPQVAREHPKNLVFVPFLLEGVAGRPTLNQADGIHPNAQGARVVADLLYPKLRALVDAMGGGG